VIAFCSSALSWRVIWPRFCRLASGPARRSRSLLPCERFDASPLHAGPDAHKAWLLGADDSLTEIRDEHVAEMEQREFDELVEGLGTSRTLAWDADDPQAAVTAYAALTAAIKARIG
jgi:hypothetical protein